jgi:hypothetical protein
VGPIALEWFFLFLNPLNWLWKKKKGRYLDSRSESPCNKVTGPGTFTAAKSTQWDGCKQIVDNIWHLSLPSRLRRRDFSGALTSIICLLQLGTNLWAHAIQRGGPRSQIRQQVSMAKGYRCLTLYPSSRLLEGKPHPWQKISKIERPWFHKCTWEAKDREHCGNSSSLEYFLYTYTTPSFVVVFHLFSTYRARESPLTANQTKMRLSYYQSLACL